MTFDEGMEVTYDPTCPDTCEGDRHIWIPRYDPKGLACVLTMGDSCVCGGVKFWGGDRIDRLVAEEIRAAIAKEREACAQILDAEVIEHRRDQRERKARAVAEGLLSASRWSLCPDSFCEGYGCVSLELLAAAIRARGNP